MNSAFIDGQNLYLSVVKQGWKLDYKKFRIYLKDKFRVDRAYIFIGYVEKNKNLYKKLQEQGYIVILKSTLNYRDGTTKGNCDAELVLNAMIEFNTYDKAVIVSGDGDFFCLADYLRSKSKLGAVIIPNRKKFSSLLKNINRSDEKYLYFLDESKDKYGEK